MPVVLVTCPRMFQPGTRHPSTFVSSAVSSPVSPNHGLLSREIACRGKAKTVFAAEPNERERKFPKRSCCNALQASVQGFPAKTAEARQHVFLANGMPRPKRPARWPSLDDSPHGSALTCRDLTAPLYPGAYKKPALAPPPRLPYSSIYGIGLHLQYTRGKVPAALNRLQ